MCYEDISSRNSGIRGPLPQRRQQEARGEGGKPAIIDDHPQITSIPTPTLSTASGTTSSSSSSSTSSSPPSPSSSTATFLPSAVASPSLPTSLPLNINVGVMGHVDSGKTSLVRSLSNHLSTAALDKHPQSQERGITLDLGFSSFLLPTLPSSLPSIPGEAFQITLVDCPGHASLIRTIIGGAQIIDLVLLLVDATRGLQAQTVECVILAEITTPSLVIALNKTDLFPEKEREGKVRDVTASLRKALEGSRFEHAPIIPVAAIVGGEKSVGASSSPPAAERAELVEPVATASKEGDKSVTGRVATLAGNNIDKKKKKKRNEEQVGKAKDALTTTTNNKGSSSSYSSSNSSSSGRKNLGLDALCQALREAIRLPSRSAAGPLYLAVDHCFPIKGQGTVLTGTVLHGQVSVNDIIELPGLGQTRKVKSLQVFHAAVKSARQGDRVGLCVTNLDAKLIERGVACTPGSVRRADFAIGVVRKIRAFRGRVKTGTEVHVSVGHGTVMATVTFFGAKELERMRERGRKEERGGKEEVWSVPPLPFDWDKDYLYQEEMAGRKEGEEGGEGRGREGRGGGGREERRFQMQYVLLRFKSPVLCRVNSLLIGSRLDADTAGSGGQQQQQHYQQQQYGQGPKNAARGGGAAARSFSSSSSWAGGCRLAFHGTLLEVLKEEDLKSFLIYKPKLREGSIYRLGEPSHSPSSLLPSLPRYREVTAQGFFKKETTLGPFVGMEVETEDGQVGRLESGFGKGGKVRIRFDRGREGGAQGLKVGDKLYIKFRRFVFDPLKKMVQRRREGGMGLLMGGGKGLILEKDEGGHELKEEEGERVEEGGKEKEVEGGQKEEEKEGEENPAAVSGDSYPEAHRQQHQQQQQQAFHPDQPLEGVDISALETTTAEMSLRGHHHHHHHLLQQMQQDATAAPTVPAGGRGGGTYNTFSLATSSLASPLPAVRDMELRFGKVDAVRAGDLVIVKGFFSMEEDIRKYIGLKVVPTERGKEGGEEEGRRGPEGYVVGPFGKGGKAKVQFSSPFDGGVGTSLTLYVMTTARAGVDEGEGEGEER